MGIIEPVQETGELSHFLPHHAVLRQDKETTKVRVVFDGSAKSSMDDLSLNDCLERGPNLVPRIFDTVVKFRSFPVGLVADVEKAFHQISVAAKDRKMIRFLWFEDVYSDNSPIKIYQFCRLPFGLSPSPAILSSTINQHLLQFKDSDNDVVSLLLQSMYVDDFAGGAFNDIEALKIYRTSQDLLRKGGFTLRKWNSNSPYLREVIASDKSLKLDGAKPNGSQKDGSLPSFQGNESKRTTVLGLHWNVENDELGLNIKELIEYAKSLPPTKRSVLRLAAKVFDPIGLITPFTVIMKQWRHRCNLWLPKPE